MSGFLKKSVLSALATLLLVDLIYLNIYVFSSLKKNSQDRQTSTVNSTQSPSSSTDSRVSLPQESISQDTINFLLEKIRDATASPDTSLPQSIGAPQSIPSQVTTSSPLREYYIPLGSSATQNREWTDLTGVEAYLAISNFGQIDSMYFEAGLSIPTYQGQVYARLKNVTDNNPLAESEIFREGNNPGLSSSGKIPVPAQTKLYRVQMKSTLGAKAELLNARIKVFAR